MEEIFEQPLQTFHIHTENLSLSYYKVFFLPFLRYEGETVEQNFHFLIAVNQALSILEAWTSSLLIWQKH